MRRLDEFTGSNKPLPGCREEVSGKKGYDVVDSGEENSLDMASIRLPVHSGLACCCTLTRGSVGSLAFLSA